MALAANRITTPVTNGAPKYARTSGTLPMRAAGRRTSSSMKRPPRCSMSRRAIWVYQQAVASATLVAGLCRTCRLDALRPVILVMVIAAAPHASITSPNLRAKSAITDATLRQGGARGSVQAVLMVRPVWLPRALALAALEAHETSIPQSSRSS